MGMIRQRGAGQYEAIIRKKGFPRQSKTFRRKKDAEDWITVTEGQMLRGAFIEVEKVEEKTLADVIARYIREVSITKKSEKQEVVRLERWKREPIAKKPIGIIKAADIEAYIAKRKKDRSSRNPEQFISGATIRLELMALSAVFQRARAADWNYCKSNPCRDMSKDAKPKPSKGRYRRLVGDEETRLLKALESHCRKPDAIHAVRLALTTAARQSELIGKAATSTRASTPGLLWEQIDLPGRSALLPDTKNGKARVIPLTQPAVEALRAIGVRESGKVLDITQDGLIRAFAAACKVAKIQDLHFHDLRHEATSRLVELGLPALEVQLITGHSSQEMVLYYAHPNAKKLAEKIDSLAQ